MADTVVVTTDDLEPAVRLRAGFEEQGWAVELLTPVERWSDVSGTPVLLVVTGGVRDPRVRTLMAQARASGRRIPILGLVDAVDRPERDACRALGLSECLPKPVEVDEAVSLGRRLIERERLREITGIVGETEAMEEALERVVQIAPVGTTVLIGGESGTGKELVARGIHALSPRRHRPFIAVNVAALPENLLESELFGHEKGAFTGATDRRRGFFELANGGTLFLDEIGEMPLATQTKLLRVLEEREFRRVGGEEAIRVDVRVIAATNRELRQAVEAGEFRRDLYHRLNVLRIELPPLRERPADIPRLVDEFIREFAAAHDRPFPGLDPEALRLLVEYDWPGNVRELRNLVESMVVLAPGRPVRPDDLPPEVRFGRSRRASLLPVLASRPQGPAAGGPTPELEFLFRTLFEMKLDLDDLRREWERFESRQRSLVLPPPPAALPAAPEPAAAPEPEPTGAVVFRPGMTMQEMEREAIGAALREARGNRRRAAGSLGIGERTLYRKLKEYGIAE